MTEQHTDPVEPLSHLYSPRARQQQASCIREICKLAARPEVKSLAGGWPAPRTFPVQAVVDIAREAGTSYVVYARRGAPVGASR